MRSSPCTEQEEPDGSVRCPREAQSGPKPPRLREVVRRSQEAGRDVLLDLSDLSFIDRSGLHAIETQPTRPAGTASASRSRERCPRRCGGCSRGGAVHHLPGRQRIWRRSLPASLHATTSTNRRSARPIATSRSPPTTKDRESSIRPRRTKDQTGSDRDQEGSDADQTGSDRDQAAADRDQRAADRDHVAHDDGPAVQDVGYEHSRRARRRSAQERGDTADARGHIAEQRDRTAAQRDETAAERDATAAERDLAADERDRLAEIGERSGSAEQAARRARRDRATRADQPRTGGTRSRPGRTRSRTGRTRPGTGGGVTAMTRTRTIPTARSTPRDAPRPPAAKSATRRRSGAALARTGRGRDPHRRGLVGSPCAGSPSAARHGGAGRPWRTAPAGGSRRVARSRPPSGRSSAAARRRVASAPRPARRGRRCRPAPRRRAGADDPRSRHPARCRAGRGRPLRGAPRSRVWRRRGARRGARRSTLAGGGRRAPRQRRDRGRGHRRVGRGVAVAEQLEAPSETAAVQRTSKGGLLGDHDQLALAGVQAAHRVEEENVARPVGHLGGPQVEGHGLITPRASKTRRGAARCRGRCGRGR